MFRSYFARNASISGACITWSLSGFVLKNWSLKIWDIMSWRLPGSRVIDFGVFLSFGVYSGFVLKNWSLKYGGYHVVVTTRVTGCLFWGLFVLWSLFGLYFKELEPEIWGISCRGDYPGHGFGKRVVFFGFFRVFWLKRAKMD